MSDRKPTSPWQRKNKMKWLYSPTYQLWREAVLANNAGRAAELACQHAKNMQVQATACLPPRI